MTFRMERDCSLSSTQRIVFFGFMLSCQEIGASGRRKGNRIVPRKKFVRGSGEQLLEPNRKAGALHCKVPSKPIPRKLCSHFFFAALNADETRAPEKNLVKKLIRHA